jgi:hypothetical protein
MDSIAILECRVMIQRNVDRETLLCTNNVIMRMQAINYITIHSVDDECMLMIVYYTFFIIMRLLYRLCRYRLSS